ncbi:phosphotransferase [Arsenicicoccus piscis]|uniref:serine protein kinase RIO n=1 Tax=Arsenicicoccus piscis TaxID=673954 RepID=UPI001F4D195A|nr:phosphotransferase [Arsenicicoccus piscis]
MITALGAVDADLGILKSGKEADVHLLRRWVPADPDGAVVLAAKRYRTADHRMFHRDAGYLEGRRVRRSRETRAMARRTDFGKDVITTQWAGAEFAALDRLWSLGLPVPYPVQLTGTEMLMEFIGTADGVAAPRLAQTRPSPPVLAELYEQLRTVLLVLAGEGWAHGDLSPYNVLVTGPDQDQVVVIDWPQIVDVIGNPHGFDLLARDVANVCQWFVRRGLDVDEGMLQGEVVAAATSR